MDELLERAAARAMLAEALADARAGRGRVVLVEGEAGIGKTSLVEQGDRESGPRARFLWGACDPLLTPRPLGPIHDVGRVAGGALERALASEAPREPIFGALLDLLQERPPTVIVFEDLHWADESSLDAVAFIGRRVERTTGTLIVTYRSDEVRLRPNVRAVLGAVPSHVARRIELSPLSRAAVEEMAQTAGRDDAEDLYGMTTGNPFLVNEVLTNDSADVPASVRESMIQRLAQISAPARDAAELAAVVPGRTESWLLQETLGPRRAALDECLTAGILVRTDDGIAFRHELARLAVAAGLSPARQIELDRRVLVGLGTRSAVDPARLVHHARRAGEMEAVLQHAPVAALAASTVGAHREALAHAEAALAAATGVDHGQRAELLERVSFEAYLCGRTELALDARREALETHRAAGDRAKEGESTRWLARLLWWAGEGDAAQAAAADALALLEPLGPSPALGMAYSAVSQLHMLAGRYEQAIEVGSQAIAIATELEDEETLVHALTNVGSARAPSDYDGASAMLAEAFRRSVAGGYHDHAGRALVNHAYAALILGRAEAGNLVERALGYARESELDNYLQYLLGLRACLHLERGEWEMAEVDARASLDYGEQRGISISPALVTLGSVQARRGDAGAAATLAQAREVAVESGELQRIAPAAAARAEHAWLEGDLIRVVEEARAAGDAGDSVDPWTLGKLSFLRWRAGGTERAPARVAAPYRLAISGDALGAAAAWEAIGRPYEAAEALSLTDDDDALLRALAAFDQLGARPAADRLRRQLRERGVRAVPRGPRPATRALPAGLTARQFEVLRLLATGATNAEIAETLVISPKTVDHHVSAVLSKLDVPSRREAARAAHELGILAAEDGEASGPI